MVHGRGGGLSLYQGILLPKIFPHQFRVFFFLPENGGCSCFLRGFKLGLGVWGRTRGCLVAPLVFFSVGNAFHCRVTPVV